MLKSVSYYIGLIIFLLSGGIGMNASEGNPVFEVRDLREDEKQAMIQKGVWKEGCPVSLERLQVVEFSYWHLEKDNNNGWCFHNHQKDDGKIVILDAAAKDVCEIFKELYGIMFPIHKASPLENYGGDDEASMADNNSSCFNCREITGGGLPSIHSYALAIDLNPVQNPYVAFLEDKDMQGSGNTKVLPPSGRDYINRSNLRMGMIENAKEKVVEIFKSHGFPVWGGKWNFPIDWQHFQTHRALGQLLAAIKPDHASVLFEIYKANSNLVDSIDIKNNEFVTLYHANPEKFMRLLSADFLKMSVEEARAFFNG